MRLFQPYDHGLDRLWLKYNFQFHNFMFVRNCPSVRQLIDRHCLSVSFNVRLSIVSSSNKYLSVAVHQSFLKMPVCPHCPVCPSNIRSSPSICRSSINVCLSSLSFLITKCPSVRPRNVRPFSLSYTELMIIVHSNSALMLPSCKIMDSLPATAGLIISAAQYVPIAIFVSSDWSSRLSYREIRSFPRIFPLTTL